jgi:hypothetical protein
MYAIKTDEFNYKVILIKEKGEDSKNPGEKYEETLAYCKNIETAAEFIINRDARMKGQAMDMVSAFKSAKDAALEAINNMRKERENEIK